MTTDASGSPRFEPRDTETPGPRTQITLDIAEASLPELLKGHPAVEIKLVDNGDGTYGLHGTSKVGDARKSRVTRPAVDELVEIVNSILEAVDEHGAPEPVREAIDKGYERWMVRQVRINEGRSEGDPS